MSVLMVLKKRLERLLNCFHKMKEPGTRWCQAPKSHLSGSKSVISPDQSLTNLPDVFF